MKKIYFILILFVSINLSAQTPQELKSWLPQIDGWNISDKLEIFDSENLFDRINGAAPLFIENNFREMTSMEYTHDDDYITIQAYRHATPEDAFGMYASERSPELKHYQIGGEAQGDDESLYFFAGNIYVKMWSRSEGNSGDILRQIATSFAKNIDTDASYPPLVKLFPKENKDTYSESYITSSYIGHEFLKGVYTARYTQGDQIYQIFLIDAKTSDEAKEILKKYYTFAKQFYDFEEGYQVIKDRYNEDIPVIWKGRYIIGIFSEDGTPIKESKDILEKIALQL